MFAHKRSKEFFSRGSHIFCSNATAELIVLKTHEFKRKGQLLLMHTYNACVGLIAEKVFNQERHD
jgi:hypothetical protein